MFQGRVDGVLFSSLSAELADHRGTAPPIWCRPQKTMNTRVALALGLRPHHGRALSGYAVEKS